MSWWGSLRSKVLVFSAVDKVFLKQMFALMKKAPFNGAFEQKILQSIHLRLTTQNLIKADKWNHLSVLTSVFAGCCLHCLQYLHAPSSINEGQCTTPASYWKTLADHFFKKMLGSSNFFGAEVRNFLYIHGRACLEVLGPPDRQLASRAWPKPRKL